MIKGVSEILGHLNGEKNYLIVLEPENLQKDIDLIIEFLVKKRQWNCTYLSLNKPYAALKKNLEAKKYDLKRFFFIDVMGGENIEKVENALFISSSSTLTKIDIAVNQLAQLTQSKGFVLVDTLEGLLINNQPNALANFIKSLVRKSAKYGSKTIVLSSGGSEEKFLNTISPFFDKVIRVDEKSTK